jgi:O-methyltransferase
MIGILRLDNIEHCVTDVLHQNVPGDLVECGVWRGGASIFMRAILKAYQEIQRIVWASDSFQGFPKPSQRSHPWDAKVNLSRFRQLGVSLEEVKSNFSRYGLLDDRVRFLAGWFKDTLPEAPIKEIAILRCDADLYESTMDILNALYSKVSAGGYVIIDDYKLAFGCRAAVDEFRNKHGITARMIDIDHDAVYWQRQ